MLRRICFTIDNYFLFVESGAGHVSAIYRLSTVRQPKPSGDKKTMSAKINAAVVTQGNRAQRFV
jgi:hypothetical protein